MKTFLKEKLIELMTREEYNANYYQRNKERIMNKMFEIVECDVCGCHVCAYILKKHKGTKKCKKISQLPKIYIDPTNI